MDQKEILSRLVTTLIKKVEATEEFVLDHAPEICKEIVGVEKVKIQNNIILFGLGVFFSCIIGFVSYHNAAIIPEGRYGITNDAIAIYMITTLSFSLFCIFFSILIDNILSLRIITVGPKILILRKLSGLI